MTSRRKLLVAPAAYAILKPFVDCLEARADAPMAPACFVVLHKTQGQYVGRTNNGAPNWIPVMEGGEMKLPRLLASFEPVKQYLTFLVGFDNVANQRSGGNWHDGSCNLLHQSEGPVNTTAFEWVPKTEEFLMKEFFAPIVIGMKDTPAGGGNLLERSLVFDSTSQSYNHSSVNHSFMLAGNAGGRLKSNRVLTFHEVRNGSRNRASVRPHNDVLISVLHAWGYTDVRTFGDPSLCKGPVDGLL